MKKRGVGGYYKPLLDTNEGTSLWLGTYLSLTLCFVLLIPGLIMRIKIEEETLIAGLEGYKEYTERVRFRLISFLL